MGYIAISRQITKCWYFLQYCHNQWGCIHSILISMATDFFYWLWILWHDRGDLVNHTNLFYIRFKSHSIRIGKWETLHTVVDYYSDVIMGTMASQITSLTIVHSTVYSGANQRKHQSSVSPAFARGIHRWPVNSSHKGPVTRKRFPFDDVIMLMLYL